MLKISSPLLELMKLWSKKGIGYCVWKGVVDIESALLGNEDLDVLMQPSSLNDAIQEAEKIGFFLIKKPEYKNDITTHDLYYYCEVSLKWYHLHLHLKAIFGNGIFRNFHLPIEKEIFSTLGVHRISGLPVINPTLDVHFFLVRHIVRRNKYGQRVHFLEEFKSLLEYYTTVGESIGTSEVFSKNVRGIVTKFITSDISSLERTTIRTVEDDYSSYRIPISATYRLDYFKRFVFLIMSKILPNVFQAQNKLLNGGKVIAFIGIDGSGKSSAIIRLKHRLSSHIDVRTASLGSGVSGSSWYRKLAFKLLGNKASFSGHKNIRKKSGEPKKFPWYYKLWLLICLYDKKKALQTCALGRTQGSLVLVDRWLQTEIEGRFDGPRTNNMKQDGRFATLLKNYEDRIFFDAKILAPDALLFFEISPATSTARKPDDLTIEQAESAVKEFSMIEWQGIKLIRINADSSIEQVDNNLIRQIRDILY